MDSGWAAIIGASIGLIGSALVGVITPMILREQQARAAARTSLAEQRAKAIRQFIHSCAATLEENEREGVNHQFSAREVALADLALLVRPDEKPILAVCERAIGMVAQIDSRLGVGAVVELGKLLPAWHRGEISAERVEQIFDLGMAEKEAEIAAEDAGTEA